MKRFWTYFNILFFPIVGIGMFFVFWFDNGQSACSPHGAVQIYLHNAFQGKVGFGEAGYYNNRVSFDGLEPGDIVLGGYPGGAYGKFTHAGIYIGNGRVIEAYADMGVLSQPVEHFRSYSQVCLLKVDADPELKNKAVEYVEDKQGELFYPIAFKPGDRIWNCTKILWKAYARQGLDLDSSDDIWVCPDAFYESPYVKIIREESV